MPSIAGLDLAAKDKNVSGIAVLDASKRCFSEVRHAYKDEEIIEIIEKHYSRIVVFDAPLSLPPNGRPFRNVELEAIKRGARLLPITTQAMRMLATRAINLAAKLRAKGVTVYETHPWSALRLSGCSFNKLLSILNIGCIPPKLSRHERDAVIAAVVGLCILEECAIRIQSNGDSIFLLKRIC